MTTESKWSLRGNAEDSEILQHAFWQGQKYNKLK